MAKKRASRKVSQASIDWHVAVLDHAFKAVEKQGFPLDKPTRSVIMRRLERLEQFLFAHFSDQGLPFQKAPFDAEDAAALILWPKWRALRLAKRLFPLSVASQLTVPKKSEAEVLELAVESFNMDWFNYEI